MDCYFIYSNIQIIYNGPQCCIEPSFRYVSDPISYLYLCWLCSVNTGLPSDPSTCWLLPQTCCAVLCLAAQACLTPCSPVDYSPPGSFVDGFLQERIPECIAMPSSRRSSQLGECQGLRPPTLQVNSLPAELPGKPFHIHSYCLFSLELCFFRYMNGLLSLYLQAFI